MLRDETRGSNDDDSSRNEKRFHDVFFYYFSLGRALLSLKSEIVFIVFILRPTPRHKSLKTLQRNRQDALFRTRQNFEFETTVNEILSNELSQLKTYVIENEEVFCAHDRFVLKRDIRHKLVGTSRSEWFMRLD